MLLVVVNNELSDSFLVVVWLDEDDDVGQEWSIDTVRDVNEEIGVGLDALIGTESESG